MAIDVGTKLGAYEITARIGAGGMGEVYKARDTRLNRAVAIKTLPEHFGDRPDLKQRFEREARTIASLNHPHICTIYDVGQHESVDYLVLEYIEGQTLAERLSKGPLPIAEALARAIEVADALDKAHRQGIVHRDVKPGNIMLTKSGAKLMDFGLAKLRAAGPDSAPMTASAAPTNASALTMQGTVLGTLQYMSPEQIEGKEADARTDIFAFGATLYEMLSGKKAFEGKSQVRLMAAILEDEPKPLTTIQPLASKEMEWFIAACLTKNPDDRWQTARDMLRELERVRENAARPVAQAEAAASRPVWRKALTAAHAFTTIALLAAIGLGYLYLRPGAAPLTRFQVTLPEKTSFFAPTALLGANGGTISPDGRRLVWGAVEAGGKSQLWVRSLDEVAAQPLNGTDNGFFPFWSPDSRTIGFFADGKLKKVAVAGGSAQTLCDAGGAPRGGSWSKDGVIVFAPNVGSALVRVPAEGGQPSPVTALDTSRQEIGHLWPAFLPDGNHFLFVSSSAGSNAGVYAGSLDASETKQLLNAEANAVYAPPGYLLFTREGTLVAQRFDASRLELSGEAVLVAEGVSFDSGNQVSAFSVSDNGALTFRTGDASTTQLTWFDRNGKRLDQVGPPGSYLHPALSPDQTRLAVTRTDTQADIWVLDLARNAFSRFTFHPARDIFPVWSPDGSKIAWQRGLSIYQKSASGAGQEELVMQMPGQVILNQWSPDGKHLLSFVINTKGSMDVGISPLEGERKIQWLVQSEFIDGEANFSPDGRWLAYASNETGRWEVYVQPFPANGARWQVSTSGGRQPQWRRDGNELFYATDDRKLYAVDVRAASSFQAGTPRLLFQLQANTLATRNSYVPSSDGRRFLVNALVEETPSPITVVLNWAEALKQ